MESNGGICEQILHERPHGRCGGRLQIRDWTDKEGNKRRSAEVIADNVYFGDSKPKDGGDVPAYEGEPGAGFGAPPSGFAPDFGEENGGLPF